MTAIELSGVVKRFGAITAVDGLDLDVPEGICLGLLGPNGAGKSTTMRLLTGQAIADEGTIRVLGYELPEESKDARAQMGVVPQLDNLDVDVTVEDNLAVFARLYRVTDVREAVDRGLALARLTGRRQGRGRQALGRHAPAAPARAGPLSTAAPDAARRADRRLDPQIRTELWSLIDGLRNEVQDDPDVDALHRGGRAARRRGCRDGAREGRRPRGAERADREARRARDRRGLRAARRLAEVRAAALAQRLAVRPAGPAVAIVGSERGNGAVPEDAVFAPRPSRTYSCCSPARRRNEERLALGRSLAIGGHLRRDEPRGGQLPDDLEDDHVLQPCSSP